MESAKTLISQNERGEKVRITKGVKQEKETKIVEGEKIKGCHIKKRGHENESPSPNRGNRGPEKNQSFPSQDLV